MRNNTESEEEYLKRIAGLFESIIFDDLKALKKSSIEACSNSKTVGFLSEKIEKRLEEKLQALERRDNQKKKKKNKKKIWFSFCCSGGG